MCPTEFVAWEPGGGCGLALECRTVPWVTLLLPCIHGHTWIFGTESWTGSPRKIQWIYKWRKNLLGVRTPSRSLKQWDFCHAWIPKRRMKDGRNGIDCGSSTQWMWLFMEKKEKALREYVFFVLYPHEKTWYIWYQTSVYLYLYLHMIQMYQYYTSDTIYSVPIFPVLWFRLSQSKGGSQLATLNSAPVDRHFTLSHYLEDLVDSSCCSISSINSTI